MNGDAPVPWEAICGITGAIIFVVAVFFLMGYMCDRENRKIGSLRVRREETHAGEVRFYVESYQKWWGYDCDGWEWKAVTVCSSEQQARAYIAAENGKIVKSEEVLP